MKDNTATIENLNTILKNREAIREQLYADRGYTPAQSSQLKAEYNTSLSTSSEDDIQKLMARGFDRPTALKALRAAGNDTEKAMNILLESESVITSQNLKEDIGKEFQSIKRGLTKGFSGIAKLVSTEAVAKPAERKKLLNLLMEGMLNRFPETKKEALFALQDEIIKYDDIDFQYSVKMLEIFYTAKGVPMTQPNNYHLETGFKIGTSTLKKFRLDEIATVKNRKVTMVRVRDGSPLQEILDVNNFNEHALMLLILCNKYKIGPQTNRVYQQPDYRCPKMYAYFIGLLHDPWSNPKSDMFIEAVKPFFPTKVLSLDDSVSGSGLINLSFGNWVIDKKKLETDFLHAIDTETGKIVVSLPVTKHVKKLIQNKRIKDSSKIKDEEKEFFYRIYQQAGVKRSNLSLSGSFGRGYTENLYSKRPTLEKLNVAIGSYESGNKGYLVQKNIKNMATKAYEEGGLEDFEFKSLKKKYNF